MPKPDVVLSEDEKKILSELFSKSHKKICDVGISYKVKTQDQDVHEYQFVFEVTNKTNKIFNTLQVRVLIPRVALKSLQAYPGLTSRLCDPPIAEFAEYIFDYSHLTDDAQKHYKPGLYPGSSFRVFSPEEGAFNITYYVDNNNFEKLKKAEFRWTVFVNGEMAENGKAQFADLIRY